MIPIVIDEPLVLSNDHQDQTNNGPPPPPQEDADFSNHRRHHHRPHDGPRGGNRPHWSSPRKRERIYCQTGDGVNGVCRPLAACYHRHGPSIKYEMGGGQCPNGLSLVCCPKRNRQNQQQFPPNQQQQQFNPIQSFLQKQELQQSSPSSKLTLDALRDIITQVFQGQSESERSNEIEKNFVDEGATLEKNSPSDLHQRFIKLRNNPQVTKLAKDGQDFLAVASRIAVRQQQQQQQDKLSGGGNTNINNDGDTTVITSPDQDTFNDNTTTQVASRRRSQLPDIDFSQTNLASRCPGDPVCPRGAAQFRYRSFDGSCNNLRHTGWGKANSPYTRILPADYEDGVNEMRRTGITNIPLPNPRTVSLATIKWSDRVDQKASVMLMQWGQFIDHDLTLAATTPMQTPQGTSIDCCNRRFLTDPRFKHPACISILLPDNDPFYSRHNIGCMNLVRNAPSPPIGCRLRAREQLNQLTHFIDASMIYGNDEQQAAGLRQFQGGLMKSSRINGAEFLPFDARIGEGCILPTSGIRRGMRCFVAGDNRVNELTGLVTTHAMLLREHNRVARLLWSLNPEWPDEKIYQETRRVVSTKYTNVSGNSSQILL